MTNPVDPEKVEPTEIERLTRRLEGAESECSTLRYMVAKLQGELLDARAALEPPATHYHQNCATCTCREPV